MTTRLEERSSLKKIEIDYKIEHVSLPKGLIESIKNAGITSEIILNRHPSDIAQILGMDDYVAQIIYHETRYYY